ncbi:DUF2750 domain-containing protein [Pedococcus badiiscoriae]|nr:DUF2750 domain-containing protein [Pedococcus badiiscoriae]
MASFYEEVTKHGSVWAIRDAYGFPAPLNGDGARAMPFWSLRSRAERVVGSVPAYEGFEVVELRLEEFVSRWLPGLDRDATRVGLNWSGAGATGYDVASSDVASRLRGDPGGPA